MSKSENAPNLKPKPKKELFGSNMIPVMMSTGKNSVGLNAQLKTFH